MTASRAGIRDHGSSSSGERSSGPVRFTDSVYMIMRPYSAQLGPISANHDTVIARLRLVASPQRRDGTVS